MQILEKLFIKHFGLEPEKTERMPISGSNREYYKLSAGNHVAVGTIGKELKENEAFISFTESFHKSGLPVPGILEVSADGEAYLQTFIDGISLFDYLEKHRLSNGDPDNDTLEIYKKVIDYLCDFQLIGSEIIDFGKCYPRDKFDAQSIMWDLNYFKYYFLKATHTVFDEQLLEDDFQKLTDYLSSAPSNYFLYRDFQSRNIIVGRDNEPYFIDYQGGRRGALQYDLASLLYDGKAKLSPAVREMLLEYYIESSAKYQKIDADEFTKVFYAFVYARIMQACGAYGYRGILEQKQHFIKSIPPAMRNLKYLLDNHPLPIELPELSKALRSIAENEELNTEKKKKLTVTVMSFSYKMGIPYDPSGNGGGFVFDCRAIHNPGKYDEYKRLTGMDQPVIDFLKNEPDMAEFCELTQQLVDMSIKKYLKRGFENLSVLFGCTGGQHRSVYSAESMARFIRQKYPEVIVNLSHREQDRRAKL